MRASWLLGTVATLLLAGAALSCGDERPASPGLDAAVSTPKPTAVARIEEVHGVVSVERAGNSAPARLSDLLVGDAVETGSDGGATLRFRGGRQIEVGPDARFVVGEGEGGLVLEVARGLVLSRVPSDQAPGVMAVQLSILTPFGITRVGKSEVAVDVGKDTAKVDVKVGSIEFVSRNGKATQAQAGQQLDLTAAGASPKAAGVAPQPLQVTVFASGGRSELKRGDKSWRPIRGESEPLVSGDSIRVRQGHSLLELANSGSRLELGRDAELTLEDPQRQGDADVATVELKRGEAQLRLGKRKTRLVLGGVELESELGGTFALAKTQRGYEVSSTAGDLKIRRNGLEQTLQAGQVGRVDKTGALEIDEVDLPSVSLPSRNGNKVFHSGVGAVSLNWEGEGPAYQVEVSSVPSFEPLVASGIVHRNRLTVGAPKQGTLYWRVTTPDGKNEVAHGNGTFAPEPATKDLARLRNEVADGAEKTTIYYQDKPPAVTLTYKPDPHATQYKVAVFRAGALQKPIQERALAQVSVPLEAGALTEGEYVWSVTPVGPDGSALRGGKMNKLELVYDNSVPTLVIQAPKNGERVGSAGVRATGVAPVGTRLWINGKPAPLDDKNRFDLTVTPTGHPPMLIFRVSRPPTADALTVRVLRRGK